MMSTTAKKIAIMQAFVDGAKIECMDKDDTVKQFNYVGTPVWDWNAFDYRVMPEKTLEQKIEEKWPDKEVVMLKYDNSNVLCMECDAECGSDHIVAQSIKGFAYYIYEIGSSLEKSHRPVLFAPEDRTKSKHPIAVLFERGGDK